MGIIVGDEQKADVLLERAVGSDQKQIRSDERGDAAIEAIACERAAGDRVNAAATCRRPSEFDRWVKGNGQVEQWARLQRQLATPIGTTYLDAPGHACKTSNLVGHGKENL